MISAFGVEHSDDIAKGLKPQQVKVLRGLADGQYSFNAKEQIAEWKQLPRRPGGHLRPKNVYAEHRLALHDMGPPHFKGRLGRKPAEQGYVAEHKRDAAAAAADRADRRRLP